MLCFKIIILIRQEFFALIIKINSEISFVVPLLVTVDIASVIGITRNEANSKNLMCTSQMKLIRYF